MTLNATLRQFALTIVAAVSIASTVNLSGETPLTVAPGRAPQMTAITRGPDGNLWFTEQVGLRIGKITPAGVITEYPIPAARGLTGIAAGPDGNIWFTDELGSFVGHIDTNGGNFHFISLSPLSHPQGITAGPDGNMWFVDELQSVTLGGAGFKIGKITLNGRVTEYATHVSAGFFSPYNYAYSQITAGPDGKLWFTNPQVNAQGRNFLANMTTDGQTVHVFNLADVPIAITTGPDNNLWVTENSHVASVTTSGVETEIPLTRDFGYTGICVGPDNNIWFTEGQDIGYVVPGTLALTEFRPINFAPFVFVSGIVTGSDGALWITGSVTGAIGRVNTAGQITNTYFVSAGSQIGSATLGPDGAVWGTGDRANLIARVDTLGVITTFPGVSGGMPAYIVSGPDGNLWFTDQGTNSIAKMTTAGVIQEFSVGQTFAGLWNIAVGPDGNLWFTEYAAAYNNVVKITTGGTMTTYPIPTPGAAALYITKGPDGNMWFTEQGAQQVAKINPNSGNITECAFPGINKGLAAIVTGPDNNLWIMETTTYGAVAKYATTCNVLAEYPVQFETLLDIKAGSDGALWLPQYYPNGMARISTSGAVSTVSLTTPNSIPNGLAFGSDGKIYVAEYGAGAFGRMSAIGGTGDTVQATHGSPFNGAVASFADGTPTAVQSNFLAFIDWGDGTRSSGTVAGPTGGPFIVSGTHTYANPGGYTIKASLQDNVDNALYQATAGLAQVH